MSVPAAPDVPAAAPPPAAEVWLARVAGAGALSSLVVLVAALLRALA